MNKKNLTYERLMHILDEVLTKVELLHTPSHDFGTGIPLYRKEIHTLQTIGRHPKINVTALAEYMGVTKGAVSQTVTRLIKKGMIRKQYAEASKKEVVLELTDLGRVGFQNHEKFHAEMFDIARKYYGRQINTKLEMFKNVMSDFNAILDEYLTGKKTI
jgi:DNA-binding MarR family transcriptional regulator